MEYLRKNEGDYMAISKSSTMMNTSRFITLAVDQYENREMQGTFYHDSIGHSVFFESLVELTREMDIIFDQMNYPVRSMESRRFENIDKRYEKKRKPSETGADDGTTQGALATFQICVQHRYNASWQGYLIWKDTDQLVMFESFLELVKTLDRILGGTKKIQDRETVESICRVAVDGYTKKHMEGRLAYTDNNREEAFGSVIALMEHLEEIAGCWDLKKTIRVPQQIYSAYRTKGHLATFVIKLLFQENNSLQGIIFWRETGYKLSFRSFLELVQLMDAALDDMTGWINQQKIDKKKVNE